jgi:CheY-like chemotaxis protein
VETNQRIAQEMIEMLGFAVDIAGNGQQAVEMFQSKDYEIVFMDCQMPVLDGYAATEKIRSLEAIAGKNTTPIVALTAGTSIEEREKCTLAGMDHHLTKPFSVSDLENVFTIFHKETMAKEPVKQSSVKIGTNKTAPDIEGTEIFNISALESIREVEKQTGKEILPQLFQGFITQMNDKLRELEGFIKEDNSSDTYKAAHAIKSMSANMGAEQVKIFAARIEAIAKNENLEELNGDLEQLKESYKEFSEAFSPELFD